MADGIGFLPSQNTIGSVWRCSGKKDLPRPELEAASRTD